MEGSYVDLLALRVIISIAGVVGNTILMISILQMTRLKSFEIFLLGLAAANLEEIVIVDVYDILLLRSSYRISIWTCKGLKFLTILGEIASILFTVLISIYRYQKLRDVHTRVNLPVFMDGLRSAVFLSVLCGAVALLFSLPTLVINLDWSHLNSSSPGCPVDFFQCSLARCPTRNRVYKYSFLLVCNLLPLLIVTLTSTMIVRILIIQQKTVRARQAQSVATTTTQQRPRKSAFQRGTLAILAAMTLFQVNWTVYLVLHLACDPQTFPLWSEVEFLITTFYTAISPYVYGMGNNLFNIKRFISSNLSFA
ncbi:vomeronasal type 1 receptor 6 [Labeo rohita]|uniref:Vomeronasal type 1 receptor 6 n=1 Tax=Labeo rohita TaxID=84645 RepID=A0A498NSH6_LABRO|nr:vomeronasal type 1 receptor 6 [Labeo rohita]